MRGRSSQTASVVSRSALGLPPHIREHIERLPEQVDRFLGSANRRSRAGEGAAQLADRLQSIAVFLDKVPDASMPVTNSAVMSVRSGKPVMALLRLVAYAVRQPMDPPISSNAQNRQGGCFGWTEPSPVADLACVLTRWLLSPFCAGAEMYPFARKLLAMQTLQACARQLAEAAQRLRTEPTRLRVSRANLFLNQALNITTGLVRYLQHAKITPPVVSLREEVAAALQTSQVMEHAAVVLLQLPPGPAFPVLVETYLNLYSKVCSPVLEPTDAFDLVRPQLAPAVSGPCADFAAMSLGLATLCAADGGPSYGLPQELMDRLPVITEAAHDAARGARSVSVSGPAPASLAAGAVLSVRAGRLGWRACREVLLRVARLAVASVQAASPDNRGGVAGANQAGPAAPAAGAAAVGNAVGPGGQEAHQRLRLSLVAGISGAVASLASLRELLAQRPAAWLEVVEEWWRLAVGLCRAAWSHEEIAAPPLRLMQLGQLLTLQTESDDDAVDGAQPMPPEPQPELAAALAAGLLPVLERLIRRVGDRPGSALTFGHGFFGHAIPLAKSSDVGWWHWVAPLLLYSDPRQAAALVVSVGKTLHRSPQSAETDPIMTLMSAVRAALSDVQDGLMDAARGSPVPPAEPSPATARLPPTLLALLAQEWLQGLVVQTKAMLVPGSCAFLYRLAIGTVTCWLPILVAAAVVEVEAAEAEAEAVEPGQPEERSDAQPGEQGGSPASATAGGELPGRVDWDALAREPRSRAGWREVVLGPGIAAERVLEVVLRADLEGAKHDEHVLKVETCDAFVLLAAAYPEAVRVPTLKCAAAAPKPEAGCDDFWEFKTLPWPPVLLRAASTRLHKSGVPQSAAGMEALAALVTAWAAGPDSDADPEELLYELRCWASGLLEKYRGAARLLGTPAAARALIPSCSNPECVSLEGDSELDVQLQRCGRCGAVRYCCRECQAAHWRAGHKAECVARPRGAAASTG